MGRCSAPIRKEDILFRAIDFDAEPDIELNLEETYRRLDRKVGTGPNGQRNEYLTALARQFTNRKARGAMEKINIFQTRVVNGRGIPSWYYLGDAAIKAVAPVKDAQAPHNADGVPDCRPVGAGNVARRASARLIQVMLKDELAEALYPAVGVSSGIGALSCGLRLSMEAYPSWSLIKTDKPNAFNENKRARAIQACLDLR